MGTYSNKSLGGLCLIIGPIVGMVCWIVAGMLIGEGDTGSDKFQDALSGDWAFLGILAMLGLFASLSGLMVLQSGIGSDENGHTFSLIGVRLWAFNVFSTLIIVGWAMGQQDMGWILGIGNLGELLGAIGIFLFALALSTRDDQNKIVQLVMAIVSLAMVVISVLNICGWGLDQELTENLAGPYYLIWTIWAVILGSKLLKETGKTEA